MVDDFNLNPLITEVKEDMTTEIVVKSFVVIVCLSPSFSVIAKRVPTRESPPHGKL
jgi:hypothetical protein